LVGKGFMQRLQREKRNGRHGKELYITSRSWRSSLRTLRELFIRLFKRLSKSEIIDIRYLFTFFKG
jgi:hypothetical protein